MPFNITRKIVLPFGISIKTDAFINRIKMKGKFIISLDFELHWGLFDAKSIEAYRENLDHTKDAIYKMLEFSDRYDIRLTFSTVGFLFHENMAELKQNLPTEQPTYSNKALNPYFFMNDIKDEENEPYYFASNIIKEIATNKNHEIGTHTYSHYYCLAEGQTINQFDSDLKAAVNIGNKNGIQTKSIVFPRNEVKPDYLKICEKHGVTSYRGTENIWVFKFINITPLNRALRLLDSYINIFGYHTYKLQTLKNNYKHCLNLPSSRFFRPYSKTLSILESLKIRRIKKAMTYAAKNNQLYHLWWHPHNFGANMNENFSNLEIVYKHYVYLNKKYGFETETMTSLTEKIFQK